MRIEHWFYLLIGIAVISLISFIYFFMKDNMLRQRLKKPLRTMIPNWLLFIVMLASAGTAVLLYINWQEQLAILFK